ncbi:hypothetical protein HPB48_005946 [Haemaphysalis longicornis]|uniref:Nuclear pore complex protein Nup153 n=1 Tax=Haemaphysalis longicornis TaxID=44386 RepID=A0A9J6FML0_HAELO|nr:hypothetical protein HPB48_005946 [Haemaphysalis longicornis]
MSQSSCSRAHEQQVMYVLVNFRMNASVLNAAFCVHSVLQSMVSAVRALIPSFLSESASESEAAEQLELPNGDREQPPWVVPVESPRLMRDCAVGTDNEDELEPINFSLSSPPPPERPLERPPERPLERPPATPSPSSWMSLAASSHKRPKLYHEESPLQSPFYSGQTTYGGAAAQNRLRLLAASQTLAVRATALILGGEVPVVVRGVKSGGATSGLSNTTRHMLATLEKMATPVAHLANLSSALRAGGEAGAVASEGAQHWSALEHADALSHAGTGGLPIVRQGEARWFESYTQPATQHRYGLKRGLAVPCPVEFFLRGLPGAYQVGGPPAEPETELPPAVSLPPMKSLPSFSFCLKPQEPASSSAGASTSSAGSTPTSPPQFSFSKPEPIGEASTLSHLPPKADQAFTFSEPWGPYDEEEGQMGKDKASMAAPQGTPKMQDAASSAKVVPPATAASPGMTSSTASVHKKAEDAEKKVEAAKTTDSTKDGTTKGLRGAQAGHGGPTSRGSPSPPPLRPPLRCPPLAAVAASQAALWECDTCLVRNQPGAQRCCACETPRPSPANGLAASSAAGKHPALICEGL